MLFAMFVSYATYGPVQWLVRRLRRPRARVQPEAVPMGPLRNAYLDALGIDRWVSRDAPAEIASSRWSAAPAAAPVLRRSPRAVCPGSPASRSRYVPLPPSADWATLRERVAGCTACAELVQDAHADRVRRRQYPAPSGW